MKILSKEVEVVIKFLSKKKYSYRSIKKYLKEEGIDISLGAIYKVIHKIGLTRQGQLKDNKNFENKRCRLARTTAIIKKVQKIVKNPNPPSQYEIARMLNTSQSTIKRIIHEDLQMKTCRKTKVHKLLPKDKKNRKTNCRKLYEQNLAGDKAEFVVTLDEANVYLNYCNGIRSIAYVKK